VRALNEQGEMFELEAQDVLSVCIQHEIDHLDGILFIDHISKLKQKRLLEKTNTSPN
jgi:peptide deformylase